MVAHLTLANIMVFMWTEVADVHLGSILYSLCILLADWDTYSP